VRTVRWILCFLFGLGALAFVRASISVLGVLVHGTQADFPATALSGGALAAVPALALVYVMACWTFLRGKPSARAWGMAASATFLLLTLMIVYLDRRDGALSVPGMAHVELITLSVGVVGLIAFSRRDVSAFAPVAKPEQGDGTHVWVSRLTVVAAITATWFALEGWERWARGLGLPEPGALICQLELLLAIPLMMFFHEAGHAAAAMTLRMKVCTFGMGPFVWSRWEGPWKFTFQRKQLCNPVGLTQVVPTRFDDFRWDKISQVAAGPVMSLLTGGVGGMLLLTAPGSPWEPAWYFLSVFATVSVVTALVNLIPFRIGGGYSDGAKLYQLIFSEAWTGYYREQIAGYAQWVTPLRPRDSDAESLWRVARWLPWGNERVQFQMLIVAHYFDCGSYREAVRVLEQTEAELRESPTKLSTHLLSVLVFYHAFLRQDAATARQWRDRALREPSEMRKDSDSGSLCALLLAEGRRAEAEDAWVRAQAWAAKLPQSGGGDLERDVVRILREWLDQETEGVSPELAATEANEVALKNRRGVSTPCPIAPIPRAGLRWG